MGITKHGTIRTMAKRPRKKWTWHGSYQGFRQFRLAMLQLGKQEFCGTPTNGLRWGFKGFTFQAKPGRLEM